MEKIVGKSCKILIKDPVKSKILFYTATEVTDMTETHIFFIDKFGEHKGFRLQDVIQINFD